MQIRDLPSTSTVESTDYLVKEQSDGTTQKIAVGDFVVNNLTSGDPNPVSSGGVADAVAPYFNGVYLNRIYRGGQSYNDVTMANRTAGNIGLFFNSDAGIFGFRINNSGVPTSSGSGLTITSQGDNVYRFTFNGEWYTYAILLTTWNYKSV
jgi:hypothetical protein